MLVADVLRFLGGRTHVLDGTLGGGGHALSLLEQGARVTGVDRDPAAIAEASERLGEYIRDGRFRIAQANYADIDEVPELAGALFDGVLLDLGVSSRQIDDDERGFSFRPGVPLDMRMSGSGTRTGADLLNEASERELSAIFRELADEPRAPRLAREIVRRRDRRRFEISDDLVDAIRGALGSRTGPADFARLFQAVRIAVNDERESLERALPILRERLQPGGVFVVIAYHSGEDGLVKRAFRDWSAACVCPPRQPVCTCRGAPLGTTLTRKPIAPDEEEVFLNPRARSARLRAWQRSV